MCNEPVCVLMCRFSRLGRSKAFPQTSHGRRFRSPRGIFGLDDGGMTTVDSMRSPELLFPVDVYESPDTDLRSSSVCVGDRIGEMTSTTSDIERSIGESVK